MNVSDGLLFPLKLQAKACNFTNEGSQDILMWMLQNFSEQQFYIKDLWTDSTEE